MSSSNNDQQELPDESKTPAIKSH